MTQFETPGDWKSEIWWRKRSTEERLFHVHFPPRILAHLNGTGQVPREWVAGSSVLVNGPSGSGKSVTAAEILTAGVESGLSGRWVEADDYIEMIKDSFDNDGLLPVMYSSPHLIKNIKGVFDIVVLDGLGEERLTEFAIHELGSLIRKRFDRMKSTVITTSLTIGDIKHRYGERLATALTDFDIVKCSSSRGK